MTADQIRAHIDPIRHEFAEPRSLVLPALKFAQTEKGHLTREDLEAVSEATGFSPRSSRVSRRSTTVSISNRPEPAWSVSA